MVLTDIKKHGALRGTAVEYQNSCQRLRGKRCKLSKQE